MADTSYVVLWAMLGWNGRCNDSCWKIKANGEKQLLPTIIVSLVFENNFGLSYFKIRWRHLESK